MDKASKSPGVAALLGRLRQDLGQDYFVEVPHWNGDRTAIGLGRPGDPGFLVYLSALWGRHARRRRSESASNRERAAFVQALVEAIRDAGQLPVLRLDTQVLATGLAREDGASSVIDTLVRF